MAQRIEAADSPDDFPTPPWATRGFMEYIIEDQGPVRVYELPRTGMRRGAYGEGPEGILWRGPFFRRLRLWIWRSAGLFRGP